AYFRRRRSAVAPIASRLREAGSGSGLYTRAVAVLPSIRLAFNVVNACALVWTTSTALCAPGRIGVPRNRHPIVSPLLGTAVLRSINVGVNPVPTGVWKL